MIDDQLIWETRDEAPVPTNPLQALYESLVLTARDMSEDRLLTFLYGVIVGWSDDSYEDLKNRYGYSDEQINRQKFWHWAYNKAWNLFATHDGFPAERYLDLEKLVNQQAWRISELEQYIHHQI